MCLRGASVIQTQVFLKVPSDQLRGYLVWMPVLSLGGQESAAHENGWRIPDGRITRYFDPESHLGGLYAPLLKLSATGPAWDVYLVFDRGVVWTDKGQPPVPTLWMHQLDRRAPHERHLDPAAMTRALQDLLSKTGRESRPAAALRDVPVPFWLGERPDLDALDSADRPLGL